MADNLNYFSDDEESEWLANIDPSLVDKSNEEKQLDDSEISSFIGKNRNSNTTKKTKDFPRQLRSAWHTSVTHSQEINMREIIPHGEIVKILSDTIQQNV